MSGAGGGVMTPQDQHTAAGGERVVENGGCEGRSRRWHRVALAVVLAAVVPAGAARAGSTPPSANEPSTQRLFTTPEDALHALGEAARTANQAEMTAIFGPDREKLLSGDPVEDRTALEHFAASLASGAKLEKVNDSKFTVLVGEKLWPFPIPIVKEGDQWRFDTAAGLDEILNRRIGRNELAAIMTCRAYVVAQWEYFTEANDTSKDGLAVYAQRFISTPGERNGLYWETAEGEKPSPLGDLIAEARAEGYPAGAAKPGEARKHSPFHGYFFKILKSQGPHAPGGKFDYVINGNMIAGFALVAFPDKWGSSGIMTFIVSQQGRVYQKNLGPDTENLARDMTEYDPDPTWSLVTGP
jgi:Protein of unknown function (DUF2950)